LLGPGYGECIALHFGNADWVVVDSCVDIDSKRSVVLDYLDLINVDVSSQVRLVVATHWHDDHIRGLAQVVRECRKARFVLSGALKSDEFLTLVSLVEPSMLQQSSGLRELSEILTLLEKHTPVEVALADRRLWHPAGPVHREVWALSPSSTSFVRAIAAFAALSSDPNRPNRSVADVKPNEASVVLWCEIADAIILLGADLEESSDPHTGWRAIVASTTRPSGRANVFKVPHHGSVTAHNPSVWTDLLIDSPTALVSPFRRGSVVLPTMTDGVRICSLAGKAYNSQARVPAKESWDPTVEAVVAEATVSFGDAEPPPGHVRLRRPIAGGTWSVELFGGAAPLCEAA
jgi:hypothetical protein